MTSESYGLVLALPVALIGARRGASIGAGAGFAAGAVLAAARLSDGAALPEAGGAGAILALMGGLVGRFASADRARRVMDARTTWTGLRLGQVGEFLSWVLYQLREYLISATALADQLTLSAPKDNPAFTDRLERLRRVLGELNSKTARLLGEKSALTTQTSDAAPVKLASLAREAAAQAQEAFASVPVSIAVFEEGQAPSIKTDRRALRLCLLAVLQNAVEACCARGGGTISVVVRARERGAELEIVDDGGGLEAPLETLFEPFYAARSGSGGLGLGLPMARRILERLGGTVRVKSRGGATAALIEVPTERGLPFVRNEESTWAGRRGGV